MRVYFCELRDLIQANCSILVSGGSSSKGEGGSIKLSSGLSGRYKSGSSTLESASSSTSKEVKSYCVYFLFINENVMCSSKMNYNFSGMVQY